MSSTPKHGDSMSSARANGYWKDQADRLRGPNGGFAKQNGQQLVVHTGVVRRDEKK
jgi:hypothetical protein